MMWLSLTMLCMTLEATPQPPAFYLWQRRRDTAPVREAIELAARHGRKIYALSGEFHSGRPALLLPCPPGATPVYRIGVNIWQKADFQRKFFEIIRQNHAAELQIDCDVPERLLTGYALFLRELRKHANNKKISATLLPSHFTRPEVKNVIQELDEVVLQLHALEKPRDLPAVYRLFDPEKSAVALQAAKRYAKKLKIALPCYAYALYYDERSGKFLYLRGENAARRRAGEIRRIAAADFTAITAFLRENPEIAVIWFRLPTGNDNLADSWDDIMRLERGENPRRYCRLFWRGNALYAENHGILGSEQLQMDVPPVDLTGEMVFFNAAEPVKPYIPGTWPEKLLVVVPQNRKCVKIAEIY